MDRRLGGAGELGRRGLCALVRPARTRACGAMRRRPRAREESSGPTAATERWTHTHRIWETPSGARSASARSASAHARPGRDRPAHSVVSFFHDRTGWLDPDCSWPSAGSRAAWVCPAYTITPVDKDACVRRPGIPRWCAGSTHCGCVRRVFFRGGHGWQNLDGTVGRAISSTPRRRPDGQIRRRSRIIN